MTLDEYLDGAKSAQVMSDNRLARTLGVTRATVSAWRTKRQWPADEHMVILADLNGVPRETALADLNAWRTKSPDAQAAYRSLGALTRDEAERHARERGMSDEHVKQMLGMIDEGFSPALDLSGNVVLRDELVFDGPLFDSVAERQPRWTRRLKRAVGHSILVAAVLAATMLSVLATPSSAKEAGTDQRVDLRNYTLWHF